MTPNSQIFVSKNLAFLTLFTCQHFINFREKIALLWYNIWLTSYTQVHTCCFGISIFFSFSNVLAYFFASECYKKGEQKKGKAVKKHNLTSKNGLCSTCWLVKIYNSLNLLIRYTLDNYYYNQISSIGLFFLIQRQTLLYVVRKQ